MQTGNRRLKIAFVVDRFGNRYGGAEAYGVALMREMSKWHDVTVLARDYDTSCDLQLHYIPLKVWGRYPSWLRVLLAAFQARRLTRSGYDIVHSHSNGWAGHVEVIHVTPVRYRWRVRSMSNLKRALSYVSLRINTYLWLEARRVQPRHGHHTVAVSSLIASQLQDAYGPELHVPVIPPGVYLPEADTQGDRASIRENLGFKDGDVVCILVARNPLRKGLRTMLEALSLLPDHYQLLVVGSSSSTEHALRKMSVFPALERRIRLVGVTSDVTPYYRAADLCVHPTLNDSFGMAPLEAMSFRLPVILSPAPWCGFAAYLTDGVDALLMNEPEDADHLAELINNLGGDPLLRERLQKGAWDVVNRHSWPRIADQYLALYQDILDQDKV